MPLPLRLLGLIAVLATGAVAAQETVKPASYTLAMGQAAELATGVTLSFDSVNDSRCPPKVQCVQAGQIRYFFTLSGPVGSEQFSLSPDTPAFTSAKLASLSITLPDAATPAPRMNNPSYTVTISVGNK
ncbi:MAG: hypothetical protein V4463_08090 [Pseudomonadota bacterium]